MLSPSQQRYRTVAFALADYVYNPHDLIRATDAIIDLMPEPTTITSPNGKAVWDGTRWEYKHDDLVEIALANHEVIEQLSNTRKIQAIKRLREISGAGLKAAKDAIESNRVQIAAGLHPNPWAAPPVGQEPEPPF